MKIFKVKHAGGIKDLLPTNCPATQNNAQRTSLVLILTQIGVPQGTQVIWSKHADMALVIVFLHIQTHSSTSLTFLGRIAAPKSGKTVAPPASTSLIWERTTNLLHFFWSISLFGWRLLPYFCEHSLFPKKKKKSVLGFQSNILHFNTQSICCMPYCNLKEYKCYDRGNIILWICLYIHKHQGMLINWQIKCHKFFYVMSFH